MASITENYVKIFNQQLLFADFCKKSANMYDFFNLQNYRDKAEALYLDSIDENRKLERHYTNHQEMLVPTTVKTEENNVYPATWLDYKRFDVTEETVKKYVEENFRAMNNMLAKNKTVYSEVAKDFFEGLMLTDFSCIMKLIDCNEERLKNHRKELSRLMKVSFDITYIQNKML